MSHQLINHSPDLKRLRDEGYDIEIQSGHLLVKQVPYVNSSKEIRFGILVSELNLAGDVTTKPNPHTVYFVGDYPCNNDGSEIKQIKNESQQREIIPGLIIHHRFSNKPLRGCYDDFFEKMTTYTNILCGPAQSIDPEVTARTFPVIEAKEDESVFKYIDTASSRAGISTISKKLELGAVGIVGLGGTGSYVLDLVAKTPVKEIRLFDGDKFSQHNAFRSPGAPTIDELKKETKKVAYFQEIYSKMRRNIVAYDGNLDASNTDQLVGIDFVFLCLDSGEAKKFIVEKMEELGIPFIDVGMGVQSIDDGLLGILTVTTSTAKKRDHVREKQRIAFSDTIYNNEYDKNIQIADLNALNAALAVIKWKKLCGFYKDLENEHYCTYTIDGNALKNEDQCE